jgi:hypothetical protein
VGTIVKRNLPEIQNFREIFCHGAGVIKRTVGCACGWLVDGVGGANTQIELANMLSTTRIANTAMTICILRCDFCFDRLAMRLTSYFNFARDYTIVD